MNTEPSDKPPVPRLGSAHLLLWAAGTGVYLALNSNWYHNELTPLGMVLLILLVLPRGAALAGLMLFVSRRVRHVTWQIEPGEWLLAIAGAWLLLETLLLGRGADNLRSPVALLTAMTCLLLVMPTFSISLAWPWKVFFLLLVALEAWPLLVYVVCAAMESSPPRLWQSAELDQSAKFWLAAGALVALILRDRAQGMRHGWLHWAGLVMVSLNVMLTVLVLGIAS